MSEVNLEVETEDAVLQNKDITPGEDTELQPATEESAESETKELEQDQNAMDITHLDVEASNEIPNEEEGVQPTEELHKPSEEASHGNEDAKEFCDAESPKTEGEVQEDTGQVETTGENVKVIVAKRSKNGSEEGSSSEEEEEEEEEELLGEEEEGVGEEEVKELSLSDLDLVHVLHPDTTLVDITQIDPVIAVESDYGIFGKTEYVFPSLVDPGLDDALHKTAALVPTYDEVGVDLYKDICKEYDIVPIQNLMDSLYGDAVDLRFYGINPKGMRAVAQALHRNRTVTTVDLTGNWLTKDAVYHLSEMLRENNTITQLNLSGCRMGFKGATMLKEGLQLTQCLKDLDLSYNELGDEGFEALASAFVGNYTIKSLNLSHNGLSLGTGIALAAPMDLEENTYLEELDLSHNKLFSRDGLKPLFTGLLEKFKNISRLNLSWNGLSSKAVGKPINVYLKANNAITHLDLSWNRLEGQAVKMIRGGVIKSPSLLIIKLGFNPIMPEEVNTFITPFAKSEAPIKELDFENIWANKEFIKLKDKVTKARDLNIKIGGIYSNHVINGPDVKKLLFDRAKFEAQKPKSKKKKKDFGHFIWKLEEKMVKSEAFADMIMKEKLKVSENLVQELANNFKGPKNHVDLRAMREYYLYLYPDTQPPPPPKEKKKKKRKGKKGKEKKEKAPEVVEEAPPPIIIRKKVPVDEQKREQSIINLHTASKLLGAASSALVFLSEEVKSATKVQPPSGGQLLFQQSTTSQSSKKLQNSLTKT